MKRIIYFPLMISIFSMIFYGCFSYLGIKLDSSINKTKKYTPSTSEFKLVDSSKTIVVITKDDRTIRGELIDYKDILNNQYDDNLPLASNLNVRTRLRGGLNFDYSIPIEEIEKIMIEDNNNILGVATILAGITIDLIIIYEIIYAIEHAPNFEGLN